MCKIDLSQDNIKESYDSCVNFQHFLMELESARREAYEEKCRREEVERELYEAFQKVSILFYSYIACNIILEDLIDLHWAQYMWDKFLLPCIQTFKLSET